MGKPTIALPPLPWKGGCQCGGIRYTLEEAPLTLYACHCTECQRQSSSGFAMSMRVRAAALTIKGETRAWLRGADTPVRVEGVFCPDCGCRILHRRPEGDTVNIKPGTLDNTRWLQPVGHLWTASKQAGVIIDPDLIAYSGQPENYDALITAWRQATGTPRGELSE